MKKNALLIILLLTILLSATAAANGAVPLTEEKKEILSAIQALEEDPLRADAKELRAKVFKFGDESDEVTIVIDLKFSKIAGLKYKYANELAFQYITGCIRFDIFNPKLAKDKTADVVSGVESIVISYANILRRYPEETEPFLDQLLALKTSNQLTLANINKLFEG